MYWPLYRALGAVLAWNVFVLLSLVAAGIIAYAWLRELGLGRGAAAVGGLVFEIAPYRALQTAGDLVGPVSLLLPLSLWAFERGRRQGWNPLWLLLSAGALASIPLSGEVNLALGAIPFYAGYALARSRAALPLTGAALAVAGAVAGVWTIRHFTIAGTLGAGERSLREVAGSSAGWLDFVVRHRRHGSESFVFIGWATPLLALAGLGVLLWWRRWGLAIVLALGALVPMALALGTTTPVFRWARDVLPPLRWLAAPAELMPIACLALAALVAFAVQGAAEAQRGRRYLTRPAMLAAVVAAVAVLADLHVTIFAASAADQGNNAYAALDREPAQGRVLELPVLGPGSRYGSVYLSYAMQSRRERTGGYSETAPPAAAGVAQRLLPLNCGDWTTKPRALLVRLRTREVAFHLGLFTRNPEVPDRRWFAWQALLQHGYRPVARDGGVILLNRRTGGRPATAPVHEPGRDSALFCGNWYPNDGDGRAMALGHAGLWAYGSGTLRLFMSSARRLRVRFSVDGLPRFHRIVIRSAQEVRVPLGRPGWHLVTLDTVLPDVNGRPEGPRVLAYALG